MGWDECWDGKLDAGEARNKDQGYELQCKENADRKDTEEVKLDTTILPFTYSFYVLSGQLNTASYDVKEIKM